MKKPRQWVGLACLLIAGAWLTGCSLDSLSPDDFDAVVTIYRTDYLDDFEDNKTFAMPEKVFDLSDLMDDAIDIDVGNGQFVLDAVAENMAELGYDRVVITGDPLEMNTDADVIVYVGAVAQEAWAYGTGCYWWYG
ncbi:MAG: DUF4136 domain-containing protein [Proteobacteria bacterium]|nr:DUF4136 domain-containing protein [Pseudomonadota bacterium]